MADALWRFGALRVDPWISLQELSYVDDVFAGSQEEETSDITATVGAGLRLYLPLGSKAYFAGYALPEYVWWQDLEERRRLNGRYGAGFFGYFNRLTLEIDASRAEQQTFVSAELPQLTNLEQDALVIGTEVEVFRSIAVFATYSDRQFRHPVEIEEVGIAPAFGRLDRDETVLRTGLRLRLGDDWKVGVGIEETETDFLDPTADRSNSGDAAILEVEYEGGRFRLRADVAERSVDPEPGSQFRAFEGTTGQVQADFRLRPRLRLALYGQQGLGYTVSESFSQAEQERQGAGLIWELGRRLQLTIYGETGQDEYEAVAGGMPRMDDVSAYGGSLRFELREKVYFQIGYSSREYDSNLPGLDRDIGQISTRFTIGGDRWP